MMHLLSLISLSLLLVIAQQQQFKEMNPEISVEAYRGAEAFAYQIVSNHDVVFDASKLDLAVKQKAKELDFPSSALKSLVRNASVVHIKKSAPRIKGQLPSLLEDYKNGSTSIVQLAQKANYSPYLLARYMVEEISIYKRDKKLLAEAMRDPEGLLGHMDKIAADFLQTERDYASKISNENSGPSTQTRLAMEVRNAIDMDPLYGPLYDKERHTVGVEYEVVLEQDLKALGIPFETETELRCRGTSKTPDILLSCPMAVQIPKANGKSGEWKLISWIDSKAMFGDVTTHHSSVIPQAEAYVHRHGPGMVLYWFGHAPLELLDNSQGDIVIASWDLPEVWMWPTGEILKPDAGG